MKAGGGHAKGAAFERLIARQLSLWMSSDNSLWRSSLSGGRATLQLKTDVVNRTQSGDLSAISSEGWKLIERYYIELKFYRDLDFAQAVIKGTGKLVAFWQRTVAEAAKYRKHPVLIAKQNRYPTVALVKALDPLFEPAVPTAIIHRLDAKIFPFDEVVRAGNPSIVTDEIWKPIPGWDEHFVSSLGNVRRLDAIILPYSSAPRYVYLKEDGRKGIKESVARLVLWSFVGLPPPGKPYACHLDDDLVNNAIWNVVWGSPRDNHLDMYANGKVDLAARNANISASHLEPEYQTKWRANQPKVNRPTIKRPKGSSHETKASQKGDDQRPVVHFGNRRGTAA